MTAPDLSAEEREVSASDREIPDTELPGMWELGDFVGGAPDVVRTSGPPPAAVRDLADVENLPEPGPMLGAVIGSLLDTYRPEGVGIWLNSPNRHLDGERPIDLIRRGEGERVLAETDRLAGGPR